MGIQFRRDHARDERSKMMRVVIPAPDQPIHIIIGHNQIYWRTVSMHYDVELGRQTPCLGDNCQLCPKPTRETTYIPCLLAKGASPAGRFSPRIVPVTDGWAEILEAQHDRDVFKVSRKTKSSACFWSIATTIATMGMTPYPGQEIENSLVRMWGIRKSDA